MAAVYWIGRFRSRLNRWKCVVFRAVSSFLPRPLGGAGRQQTEISGGFWVHQRSILRKLFAVLAVAIAAVALGACGGEDGSEESAAGAPKILASTPQVGDLVTNVAGSRAPVTTLVPVGVNPHTFVPQATAMLEGVDIAFINGGDMDPWAEAAIKQASPNATIVDLSKSAKLIGRDNSHWITDIDNAKLAAAEIAKTLTAADSGGASVYTANQEDFSARADELDEEIVACTSTKPVPQKLRVVAAHDDVDYWAKRYEFEVVEQIARSGDATEPKASVESLGRRAKSRDAGVVATAFAEFDGPGGMIAQQAGVPKVVIYSDTLSDKGQPAKSLLLSIAHSIGVMVESATDGKSNCRFPKSLR